jgi:hypothetical protein
MALEGDRPFVDFWGTRQMLYRRDNSRPDPMKQRWNSLPRWFRLVLKAGAGLFFVTVLVAGWIWWYFHPAVTRTDGVVYGQRHEHDLTLDIVRPQHPNGLGIALISVNQTQQ